MSLIALGGFFVSLALLILEPLLTVYTRPPKANTTKQRYHFLKKPKDVTFQQKYNGLCYQTETNKPQSHTYGGELC